MSCPDPNLIAEFGLGELPPRDHAAIADHVNACADCRGVIAALARSSLPCAPAAELHLAAGARIGRFTILARVGAGAMGSVYAAYDPQLDRKVALKILHAASPQEGLLTEARAMARLAHPHAVSVLDLGLAEGRVFLAMEFVEGVTLAAWLAQEGRPWREVLRVLTQAGRGLAASHAAGLTHRDFKPANVLVGRDGRVRVSDFGLARPAPAPGDDAPPRGADALASERGGTPAYMAPEQFQGRPAGPLTDQFSFCVVLWEALYGAPPFDAGRPPRLDRLAEAVLRHQVQIPADARGVPVRLRRALLRGLAPHPSARFPSMDALLEEIGRDPPSARRRLVLSAAATLTIAAISAGGAHLFHERRQLCTGAEGQLAGIWDAPRQATLHGAFLGTGLPYATHAARGVSHTLDAYSRGWAAMHADACAASRLRGEQSAEVLDLRMMCLSDRLAQLRAATDLLVRADGAVVERADKVAAQLAPVSACADIEALKLPLRPPAEGAARARVQAARARIAQARSLAETDLRGPAQRLAQQALDEARASGYAPVEAEALAQLGAIQRRDEDQADAAERTLEEAFFVAEAARHDAIGARVAAGLVHLLGERAPRRADAERWGRLATAVLRRGRGDGALEGFLEDGLGALLEARGQYEEALARYRRALTLTERALAPDHREAVRVRDHIGNALAGAGRLGEALREHGQMMQLLRRTVGPEHPDMAHGHNNIATTLATLGRYAESLLEGQRAAAIWRRALAPEHTLVAAGLLNVGTALQGLGRFDEAIATYQQAMAIWRKKMGAEDPDVANCYNNIGVALIEQHRYAAALDALRQALPVLERTLGAAHPWSISCRANLSDVLLRLGRIPEALGHARHALATAEGALGPAHPQTAMARGAQGKVLLAQRLYLQAQEQLQRALAVIEERAPNPLLLGEHRFALAQARWGAGADRAGAVDLARRARADWASLPGRPHEVAVVEAWIAARAPRDKMAAATR